MSYVLKVAHGAVDRQAFRQVIEVDRLEGRQILSGQHASPCLVGGKLVDSFARFRCDALQRLEMEHGDDFALSLNRLTQSPGCCRGVTVGGDISKYHEPQ